MSWISRRKHIFAVAVLIILVTGAAWIWLGDNFESIVPVRASEEGAYVDRLFAMHLYVIAFLFALIVGFMIYSIVVFRRKPGDTGHGAFFHGNATLEVVWTIIPLGVVLYFATLGAQYLRDITAPEANELQVRVIGSQWNWRFDYPEYDISSPQLYLPTGRQTVLEVTSLDVLHSFWVPEFRVKQDAVPGMVNPLRVTPTEVGQYEVRCAELCGTDHAYMLATVNVLSPDDFSQWLHEQTEPPLVELTEAELGHEIAELNGCFKCHTVDGTEGDGPTWLGLFGELEDGTTLVADDEYIRESILDPQAKIVAGFTDVEMPVNFAEVLTDEDINDLIGYIESLGE
jgi:cytochrome c oxidase subunit 2